MATLDDSLKRFSKRSFRGSWWALTGLFVAVISTTPRVARASVALGADWDVVTVPLDDGENGSAFGARLGSRIRMPLLVLTPEVGVHADFLASRPDIYRGVAGLRLGVGDVFRPGIMAHVGVGHVFEAPYEYSALAADAGVFFDFTLLPMLDVGAHATYNYCASNGANSALDWAALGIHTDIIF